MADDESENQNRETPQLSTGTDYDIEAFAKWKRITKEQALELINTSKEQAAELLKEYLSHKAALDVEAEPLHGSVAAGTAANSNLPSGDRPPS